MDVPPAPRISRIISKEELAEMIADVPPFTELAAGTFGPGTTRSRPREESEARLLREVLNTPERLIGPVVPDGTIYLQEDPALEESS